MAPAPDGSVWGTQLGYPGALIRLAPGSNPPDTALVEIYQPPVDKGFSPRGGDVDRNGVLGGHGKRPSRELRSPQVKAR